MKEPCAGRRLRVASDGDRWALRVWQGQGAGQAVPAPAPRASRECVPVPAASRKELVPALPPSAVQQALQPPIRAALREAALWAPVSVVRGAAAQVSVHHATESAAARASLASGPVLAPAEQQQEPCARGQQLSFPPGLRGTARGSLLPLWPLGALPSEAPVEAGRLAPAVEAEPL